MYYLMLWRHSQKGKKTEKAVEGLVGSIKWSVAVKRGPCGSSEQKVALYVQG